MTFSSPALTATLRALRGGTDVRIIAPALYDPRFARVLALAPGVHPIIGALGALAGGCPELLSPAMRQAPALSAAVASLIGTDAGDCVLPTWARVASTGWGVAHADALIDAVQRDRCPRWTAAALIGPCDASAALLIWTEDIARAVPCWGKATPDDPTAWMNHLASANRDRLVNALRASPNAAVACLPWLPEECAATICRQMVNARVSEALDIYADASPVARDRHTDALAALMQRADWYDLAALTRLAVATGMNDAWDAVLRLLPKSSDKAFDVVTKAVDVVTAAPWDMLRADVQRSILSAADADDVCAAIAFALGMRSDHPTITWETARAFFAAATPTIWDELTEKEKRIWLSRLNETNAHLAVRSLGIDPAFLTHAILNDSLIGAVSHHVRDDAAVVQTLLPISVRDLPLDAVPDVVAALPLPPDPVAFVQIACGERDMHPALRDWIMEHPTLQALAGATPLLHAAKRYGQRDGQSAALSRALAGWSWEETNALLAALPKDVRTTLLPDRDTLANTLAHPDRQDAFRQALDTIDSLPPAATLSALLALETLVHAIQTSTQRQAGKELARALRDHGRTFTAIVRALHDNVRSAILPRQDAPHIESELEDIAGVNPLVAYHLAYALRDFDPDVVIDVLTAAPPQETQRIWRLLPDALQCVVLGDINALAENVAAEGQADALAQMLLNWVGEDDPRLLLALRDCAGEPKYDPLMLLDKPHGRDEERWTRGIALFAQHPDAAAALLPLLRDDLRTALASDPTIAFASADLPSPRGLAPVRRRRR
jgi:hypothetical protein